MVSLSRNATVRIDPDSAVRASGKVMAEMHRPSPEQLPVQAFITPHEFAELRNAALPLGFRHVESGPMVRSSYHAWEHVK